MINYDKIVTTNIDKLMTIEELNILKKMANRERTYIHNSNHTLTSSNRIQKKATERVYISSVYNGENDAEKAIILANVVLPNDEKIAKILLSRNLDYQILSDYLSLLKIVKFQKSIKKDNNNPELEAKINKINTILLNTFNLYYGNINIETIINRINEIISFRKELLITNSTTFTKTKNK